VLSASAPAPAPSSADARGLLPAAAIAVTFRAMNDRLIRALRREPVDCTPVWFMRQAGRSLPRYRETRAERQMFELLRDPAAAADVTALPLEYYPVDAAVLYNDLSTPYFGAGFDVEMKPGVGPLVHNPIRSPADIDRMTPFDPRQTLDYNMDQIRLLVKRLDVPVLGFVGAPFTLCSYLIDAPRSRDLAEIKSFMWREPEAWHRLADFWATHMAEFGIAQFEAGAGAVQVFDSWAGALAVEDYERYVLPHTAKLLGTMEDAGVPTINFAIGNPALLPLVAEAGGTAISVDWRLPIEEAWRIVGHDRAIQGNLDPTVLLAGEKVAIERTREILQRVGGRPGHIFNCGHGLLPETDHNVVRAVVDFVHDFTARG
jgi:uroporphyrinogen decarboxylase